MQGLQTVTESPNGRDLRLRCFSKFRGPCMGGIPTIRATIFGCYEKDNSVCKYP